MITFLIGVVIAVVLGSIALWIIGLAFKIVWSIIMGIISFFFER